MPCGRPSDAAGALGVTDPDGEVVAQLRGVARGQVDLVADAVERERDGLVGGELLSMSSTSSTWTFFAMVFPSGFRPLNPAAAFGAGKDIISAFPKGKAS
jgi:hypothetical protein